MRTTPHSEQRRPAIENRKPINFAKCPCWLIRTGNRPNARFTVKAGAEAAICYAFERTIEGLGGPRVVCELNRKFPAFGHSETWNAQFLRTLLTDRRVLGEYTPRQINSEGKRVPLGEPIPDYFPRIIDDETYQQAQMAIAHRRTERGASSAWINLFTGLIWHAVDKCACSIQATTGLRKGKKAVLRRLQSSKHKKGVRGASASTIELNAFEDAVLTHLRELDLSILDGRASERIELASLVNQAERQEAKIAELRMLLESDDDADLSEAVAALKRRQAALRNMQSKIDELQARANTPTAKSLRTIKDIDASNNENRIRIREALKRVVKRIWILPVKMGTSTQSHLSCWIEIELTNGATRTLTIQHKSSHSTLDLSVIRGRGAIAEMTAKQVRDFAFLLRERFFEGELERLTKLVERKGAKIEILQRRLKQLKEQAS